MSSCIKRVIAGFAAAVIIASPTAVHAAYTYVDAVDEFNEMLEIIDAAYYFSDELDYKKLLDSALVSVFDQLDDYSEYLTLEEYEEFSSYHETNKPGIGVSMLPTGSGYVEIVKVYNGSSAQKSGLLKGDIITEVSGIDVSDKSFDEIRELIIGVSGTDVTLSVLRGNELKQITATRGTFYVPQVERTDISELISGADNSKTAYIEVTSFSNSEDPKSDTGALFKALYEELKKEKIENLIIDLRGNTGGDAFAVIDMAELLVKTGKIFTFKYAKHPDEVFTIESVAPEFNVAILVDGMTASASEIFAAAMQDSGSGIIVGSQTFGKGVVQMPLPLKDEKHIIKFTVAEIVSRNGNSIDGVGVTPDVIVSPPPWIKGTETISSASSEEEIASLKSALNYLGYDAGTGALYDTRLTEAVKSFQSDASLTQDGNCTPEIIDRINGYVSEKSRKSNDVLKKAYEILNK